MSLRYFIKWIKTPPVAPSEDLDDKENECPEKPILPEYELSLCRKFGVNYIGAYQKEETTNETETKEDEDVINLVPDILTK